MSTLIFPFKKLFFNVTTVGFQPCYSPTKDQQVVGPTKGFEDVTSSDIDDSIDVIRDKTSLMHVLMESQGPLRLDTTFHELVISVSSL